MRVPRLAADRVQRDGAPGARLGRYRCVQPDCDWQGLLPRPARRLPPPDRRQRAGPPARWAGLLRQLPWSRIGGVSLAAALMVLTGVQAARHFLGAAPMQLALAPGESHDGDLLPRQHPWLRPVSLPASAAQASEREAAVAAVAPVVEPLDLRRGCAWGQPGRNPYRGSVEQALLHARLPPEVVRDLVRKVSERQRSDRLEIKTGRIHGVKHGREFDPDRLLLSFGRTLCLNSRVNFPSGHTEGADLYESTDARGRQHAVMVPDICGNVSVLGERGERRRTLLAGGADDEWSVLATGAALDIGTSVPEPDSLLAVLAAMAALAVLRQRQGRR